MSNLVDYVGQLFRPLRESNSTIPDSYRQALSVAFKNWLEDIIRIECVQLVPPSNTSIINMRVKVQYEFQPFNDTNSIISQLPELFYNIEFLNTINGKVFPNARNLVLLEPNLLGVSSFEEAWTVMENCIRNQLLSPTNYPNLIGGVGILGEITYTVQSFLLN